MPRIPTHRTSRLSLEADDDPPRRLGRAGLDALMRDPRYLDGNHPEHDRVLDLVRRGFEMVFAAAEPKRRLAEATSPAPWRTPPINPDTPAPVSDPEGPLGRGFARLGHDPAEIEAMPTALRGELGRRIILGALKDAGFAFPSGFEEESSTRAPGAAGTSQPGRAETAQADGDGAPGAGSPAFPIPPRRPEGSRRDGPKPPAIKPPDYRSQVFAGARAREWEDMNQAAHDAAGGSAARSRAYMEIFAAEGGLKRDPDSGAVGGVTQGALEDIKKREPTLKDVATPDQLDTPEKMATAYRGYLKFTMNRYGGPEALDGLKQPETAATVADTLFMHGHKGGDEILKNAIRDVDAGIGQSTSGGTDQKSNVMTQIQELDKAGKGQEIRDAIARRRIEASDGPSAGERARIDHFRFNQRK